MGGGALFQALEEELPTYFTFLVVVVVVVVLRGREDRVGIKTPYPARDYAFEGART